MTHQHACLGGVPSSKPSWWLKDAHGIELCRVCTDCIAEKKRRYRPEILTGYTQEDVNEPIEPEDSTGFAQGLDDATTEFSD